MHSLWDGLVRGGVLVQGDHQIIIALIIFAGGRLLFRAAPNSRASGRGCRPLFSWPWSRRIRT